MTPLDMGFPLSAPKKFSLFQQAVELPVFPPASPAQAELVHWEARVGGVKGTAPG